MKSIFSNCSLLLLIAKTNLDVDGLLQLHLLCRPSPSCDRSVIPDNSYRIPTLRQLLSSHFSFNFYRQKLSSAICSLTLPGIPKIAKQLKFYELLFSLQELGYRSIYAKKGLYNYKLSPITTSLPGFQQLHPMKKIVNLDAN